MTNLKEANNDNFLADTYINSNQTVSKTFLAYQLISKCSDEDFEAVGMSALQKKFLLKSLEIADLPNPYDGEKEFK